MKIIKFLILCGLFLSVAHASKFTVTTDDSEIDFSSLDKNILVKIEKNEFPKKYVTPAQRDEILKRHIPKFMEKHDDFERELFYNDLFHFSHKKLKNKYDFLDEKTIFNLKKDFLKK